MHGGGDHRDALRGFDDGSAAALCGDDRNGRRRDGADSRCGRLYRRCGRRVHGFYRGSDPGIDFYRGFGGTAAGGGKFDLSKVVGSAISLPGLWVLAAVTIGGGVMGILGMLLGVPLAASAYRLLRDEVSARIDGDADRCGRSSDGNADRCGRSSGGNADCRGCPSDEDAESALSRQTKEKMEASSGAESSEQENGTL